MNVHEIAAAVSSRRASAVEIVRATLDRMAAAKALNAVVTVDAGRSLSEAAAIDRRLQLGESMPLAGVPVVIKDNIWVDGWRVTQGSRLFADFVAPCDAIAVERLKKAGAIVVGMSATSEFACARA
jgi:aspartyl-tRNA(Asn)/glutamyl-tRNA(Gln) amidotransferase subunit A